MSASADGKERNVHATSLEALELWKVTKTAQPQLTNKHRNDFIVKCSSPLVNDVRGDTEHFG